MAFEKHYNDEALLAHLDGELPKVEEDQLVRHLKTCWECRAKSGELGRQIEALTAALASQQFPGPHCLFRAKERLLRSQAEFERDVPPPVLARAAPPLPWLVVGTCCVLSAVVFLSLPGRKADPSEARRLLGEVERAGDAAGRSPTHQLIRTEIRSLAPNPEIRRARLDVWREPEHRRFAARWSDESGALRYGVWRTESGQVFAYDSDRDERAGEVDVRPAIDLREITRNGLAPEQVESMLRLWLRARDWGPVSMLNDLRSLAANPGAALAAETSSGAWRLTASTGEGSARVTIALEAAGKDRCPRTELARFESLSGLVEVRLIVEEFERVPRSLVQAAVFRPYEPARAAARIDHRAAPAPIAEPPAGPQPAARDLASLEVQAQYLLHDAEACLGEPLEARIEGGEVIVRGLVADEPAKAAYSTALAQLGSPFLRTEIRTYEQAARSGPAPQAARTTQVSTRAARSPLEDLLAAHFGNEGGRVAGFSSEVIAAADAALAQAWALRRLEERYDRADRSGMTAASRRLVQAMKSDHELAMSASVRELRKLLNPVIAQLSESRSHGAHSQRFDAVRASNRLIHGLFAGAGLNGQSAAEAAGQLWAELAAIQDPAPAAALAGRHP